MIVQDWYSFPSSLITFQHIIKIPGMRPDYTAVNISWSRTDLQIVYGEITAYEVAGSILVAETDNGTAGMTDGPNPGAFGHAMEGRHHSRKPIGKWSHALLLRHLRLRSSSNTSLITADPDITAGRKFIISNRRRQHISSSSMTAGGQKWGSSGRRRGQRWASTVSSVERCIDGLNGGSRRRRRSELWGCEGAWRLQISWLIVWQCEQGPLLLRGPGYEADVTVWGQSPMAGDGGTERNHQPTGKLTLQPFCQDGAYFELGLYCWHRHLVVCGYELQLLLSL